MCPPSSTMPRALPVRDPPRERLRGSFRELLLKDHERVNSEAVHSVFRSVHGELTYQITLLILQHR